MKLLGIFLSTFLQLVNGSKNSILNWVVKLNLFMCFFFEKPLKTQSFHMYFCFFWITLKKFPLNSPTLLSLCFFLSRIHSMQGWTATTRHGVTRKRSQKILKHAVNLFKRTYSEQASVNSRLKKPFGSSFYRQRTPESSFTRKETVDIDILTSRSGKRKIMQSIRIMSRPPLRKREWNQLSQLWRTSTKVIPIEKT